MKLRILFAGLLLGASVMASMPADFADQWALQTQQPGAYAIALDAGIYEKITRNDLSDLAAFNADGEELAFGPLPAEYTAPARKWHDAVWFALPGQAPSPPSDLQLHVSRGSDGTLSLDSTLSGAAHAAAPTGTTDLLVDVRAKDRLIEALSFDFTDTAPDFSALVEVDASDDLQHWRPLVEDAPIARFRQHGEFLIRHTVEFPPATATYLRVHASAPLALLAVHQLQREPGNELQRASLDATFERREHNAFIYRLPARAEVERLSITLADDNAVAQFSVSSSEEGESDWRPVGDYMAFRLRGAGIDLDAEPLEIDGNRAREWRIESAATIAKPPVLRFDYRPESWVVLTHGRAPYTIVAGSLRARRGDFPIDALIGQMRARYGARWQPPMIGHGAMQAAAGDAALHGWDAAQGRTWLLWGVLVLGAGAVAFMVIGLLRSPGRPKD